MQHVERGAAGISFRMLLLIPHTDGHRFRAAWDDEHNLVLEALLLAQQGNDLFLERLRKLRDTIGFQLQGNFASTHVNLQGVVYEGQVQISRLSSKHL